MFEALDTIVIRVVDVDAAVAWYQEKLELRPAYQDPHARLAVLHVGGPTSLTLRALTRTDVAMVPGAATTYPTFAVDDVDRVWRTLRERDVLVEPIVTDGEARSFQFLDFDGNRLEARQVGAGV